jgi:prepilin signal peptidase PulO-like enzyme (type II secretory pathway)
LAGQSGLSGAAGAGWITGDCPALSAAQFQDRTVAQWGRPVVDHFATSNLDEERFLIIISLLFALGGWLMGIAINHAADLLPRRETLRQWPACSQCGTRRRLSEWSSLVALLNKRSTCPACGQPRPTFIRSVIVELVTPLFFLFLLFYFDLNLYLFLVLLYTAILILITVTDLEHRLIFNVVILPAILLGIIGAFFTPHLSWKAAMLGGAVAFIVVYVAALLARGGLGEGDVTLSAFLGLILGFPHIILSLLFGVFLGGAVVIVLLISRRVGLKSFVPYGPFLTITGWIMLIWGSEIWQYYF